MIRRHLCVLALTVSGCLAALAISGCGPAMGGSSVETAAARPVPIRAEKSNESRRPPDDDALLERIDHAVAITRQRHLNPKVQSAWQIVHGILAFGRDLKMEVDGQPVSALEVMLQGRPVPGWNLEPGPKGLEAILEAGSKTGQGHEDQWIGYLSQCGLTLDDPIVAGGLSFTIADLVEQAKWDVRENMEATWTLMAFATYLPLDAEWQARDGSQWSLERLVGLEAKQPIVGEACGGTHRLYALALALNRRREAGLPLTGAWADADEKVRGHVRLAKDPLQFPDGAFSTRYFDLNRSASPDVGLRISTTGHILEFLAMALSREELGEGWVVRSVDYLCTLLEATEPFPVECGGLYHAAHGLRLYRDKRFGAPSPTVESDDSRP